MRVRGSLATSLREGTLTANRAGAYARRLAAPPPGGGGPVAVGPGLGLGGGGPQLPRHLQPPLLPRFYVPRDDVLPDTDLTGHVERPAPGAFPGLTWPCPADVVWGGDEPLGLSAFTTVDEVTGALAFNSAHPLAADASGNVYVAFVVGDEVVVYRRDVAAAWGRHFTASGAGAQPAAATVAVFGDLLAVVWTDPVDSVNAANRVSGVRFNSAGKIDVVAWAVTDATHTYCRDACATFDEDGRLIVVFCSNVGSGTTQQVTVARSEPLTEAAGSPPAAWDRVVVSQQIPGETDNLIAQHASVAVSNGTIAVVYKYSSDDALLGIYVAAVDAPSGGALSLALGDLEGFTTGGVAEVYIAGSAGAGVSPGYGWGTLFGDDNRAHDPCICAGADQFVLGFHGPNPGGGGYKSIGYCRSGDGRVWSEPEVITGSGNSIEEFTQFVNLSAAPETTLQAAAAWEMSHTNERPTVLTKTWPLIGAAVSCEHTSRADATLEMLPADPTNRSPPPSSADPYPYRTWPYVFVDVNLGVHLITVGQNAASSAPDIYYQGGSFV